MKRTTLALDERVLAKIKQRARREKRTLQDVANELLRRGKEHERLKVDAPEPLPVFGLGEARVDIADREALLDLMDGDDR